ncbi:MAG: hypothetical protein QOJ07_1797, partial [Thermoleophilaceae bacterium]|nr:hypothetical protein [Thermoleophilaceae bacterium]
AGAGADTLSGGSGFDVVSYRDHDPDTIGPGVIASIGGGSDDGNSTDGADGARDDVRDDVEGLVGTDEDDVLTGTAGPDAIDGLGGEDRIDGGGGDDAISEQDAEGSVVNGGSGDDLIEIAGDFSADGGPGDDVVSGGLWALFAQLAGGSGADRIYAGGMSIRIDGGAGPDLVASGLGSSGSCGDGDDIAVYWAPRPLSGCETERDSTPRWSSAFVRLVPAGGAATTSDGFADERRFVSTTVRTPHPGVIAVEQLASVATPPPTGSPIPMQIDVRAPAASDADPLTVEFRIDATAVPLQLTAEDVDVYLDGVIVPRCVSGRVVDPCVSSRSRSYHPPDPVYDAYGHDDVAIDVLSSRAGRFTFGLPAATASEPASPPSTPAGDAPDGGPPTLGIAAIQPVTLKTLLRTGLRVPLRCSERCASSTELRLAPATARKLRLPERVGRKAATVTGRRTLTVKLTARAVRTLRRQRSVLLTVRATAADAAGNPAPAASKRVRAR